MQASPPLTTEESYFCIKHLTRVNPFGKPILENWPDPSVNLFLHKTVSPVSYSTHQLASLLLTDLSCLCPSGFPPFISPIYLASYICKWVFNSFSLICSMFLCIVISIRLVSKSNLPSSIPLASYFHADYFTLHPSIRVAS